MIKVNFELWKDIKGFEGLYQVSTLGRVRSLDKYIDAKIKNVDKVLKRGKILKPYYGKDGYLRVHLCKNGKRTRFLVHRLVAEAFISNPDNLPCVNHKDEDKTNNYPCNLEWCTYKYNTNYGTRNKRASIKLINREDLSKKVYQYDLKGNLINVWASTMDCDRNGFCYSGVSSCCLGNIKIYKKYVWSYTPIENFDINNYLPKRKNKKGSKKVYQYDKDYNLIKIWPSIRECGRNGFSRSHVSACCLGKEKFHKSFIWSYEELS